MRVACNASLLIWLSHTGHFSLLQELFEVVFIPPEVQVETVSVGSGQMESSVPTERSLDHGVGHPGCL